MALPSMEDVREALVLVEQLKSEPGSHLAAELAGGPQFLGWDDARYIAAETRDILLAIASGLGGKKITAEDLYKRPQRTEEQKQAATIADFDVDGFMRRLGT